MFHRQSAVGRCNIRCITVYAQRSVGFSRNTDAIFQRANERAGDEFVPDDL